MKIYVFLSQERNEKVEQKIYIVTKTFFIEIYGKGLRRKIDQTHDPHWCCP